MEQGAPRLRIVVVGQSVGYFVRPPRATREAGNYGEVLERRLRDMGIDATVTNSAGWFLLAHDAFADVENLVLRHTPDVVITNFGMGECQPKVIPTRVLLWLYTWRPSSSMVSRLTRRLLLRWVKAGYVKLSPRLIKLFPRVPYRLSPDRFELEMRRLVRLVRKERQALVLMLNANPAGPKLEAILPGTDGRSQEYNEILERIAADEGDAVRVIDARTLVLRMGLDVAIPDGIHFSSKGHEAVAEVLAEETSRWAVASPAMGGRQREAGHAEAG